ncbi:MAG TPA: dienelactone hydrolase family protein [Thermoanaerobaculia bacterium]|nr:dienelactone hydrolase family protein [Thermoanaerobaculia bacterium]
MRKLLLVTAFALACQAQHHDHGAAPSSAATATNPFPATAHAGTAVKFGDGASGYLALPAGAARKPAIIVIQEWWGLNDWVKEQADRYASQGYVALAPDLYRGRVATTMDEAHELSRGLPEDRAIGDLKGAFNYLASRDDVDPKRIGVIGWCMGGGYALGLALNEPRLAAVVMNYGRLVTDPAAIAKLNAPLLGNFGAADRGIPAADVQAFDAALKKAGKSSDIKIYEGAGHAFMNENNKQGYAKDAAADAQKRIDAFFASHLRG